MLSIFRFRYSLFKNSKVLRNILHFDYLTETSLLVKKISEKILLRKVV
jgi:hypothetical protein